jgi:alkylation response protein AidB-like acyl-CoA dehydrogenase
MNFGNQELEKHADSAPSSTSIDWVARAIPLGPVIEAAIDRIETERKIPTDVMSALHDAELFRMCLPPWLGGGEAAPRIVLQVIEIIAAVDASTAWCLGQALGCSRMAGFLDRSVAKEVFGNPDAVLAWGPPDGSANAVAVDGGYRVTGKWRLVSGIRNANWLGPICAVCEPDGTPRRDADGKPVTRSMLLPISSATLTDVWHVIGLRGTGSDSFAIDDLFVPEAFSLHRDSPLDRREDGPLYRLGLSPFYAVAFAGVALGVARTTLDDFILLAAEKKPSHWSVVMRENPAVQRQVAEAEANLGSARSYLFDMLDAAWDSGHPPDAWPLELRARLRIACTHAVTQSRGVVEFAYQAAGSGAIFQGNPFERRFRDINTVAQQAQGQPINFEHAGSALMGLEQKGGRV